MPSDEGFDWGRRSRMNARSGHYAQARGRTGMPRSPSEALEPARGPKSPYRKPRRHLHPIFAFLNGLMTLSLVALIGAGGLVFFFKARFDEPGPLSYSTVFVIPRGESTSAIAARLEREGIINDRRIFMASVRYFQFRSGKKLRSGIKAGEYEIRRNANMRNVLDALIDGRVVSHKVSVPEGLTSEQIVARLNGVPILNGEIAKIPPEGSLLPDTYLVSRTSSRADLIARMQAAQKKFVERLWPTRTPNLPFKTIHEALVLASIVEKETARPDERQKIAGVFINRLRNKIRLQSDPTIIYGLAGGKGTLGRPILRSEINKVTPYNTYQIDGLPPTPIANPGRAAIEAVLNPEKTADLYFVADGTGGHVFSKSLQEHDRNVAKWRIVEREIRAKEAAALKAAAEEGGKVAAEIASAQEGVAADSGAGTLPSVPPANGVPVAGFPGLTVSGGNLSQLKIEVPQGGAVTAVGAQPAASPPSTTVTTANAENDLVFDIPLPVRRPRRN